MKNNTKAQVNLSDLFISRFLYFFFEVSVHLLLGDWGDIELILSRMEREQDEYC